MGLQVNRWLKYAKARLDAVVGSGNERLDELEAEREAERADKPWLRHADDDRVAPSFDQVRERIDWEAERQGVDGPRAGGGVPDRPEAPSAPERSASGAEATDETTTTGTTEATGKIETDGRPEPRSPEDQTEDAEREMARLELEARQRASAERLEEIRRELGVDAPDDDEDPG